MHAIRNALLALMSIFSGSALSSIVPSTDEVVATDFKGDIRSGFLEGYIELNKTLGTISLVLQPAMKPCANGDACPEVMPAPFDYYLKGVKVLADECGAISYAAEQSSDHALRVRLVDNSNYNYEACPTFVPVPVTAVEVEQIFYGPSSTDEKTGYFAAEALTPVRY